MTKWYVYLLRCADNSLYCGVTTEPKRRLTEHNSGKGAKYTRSRTPVEFDTIVEVPDRSSACRLENLTKRRPKDQKSDFMKEQAALLMKDNYELEVSSISDK